MAGLLQSYHCRSVVLTKLYRIFMVTLMVFALEEVIWMKRMSTEIVGRHNCLYLSTLTNLLVPIQIIHEGDHEADDVGSDEEEYALGNAGGHSIEQAFDFADAFIHGANRNGIFLHRRRDISMCGIYLITAKLTTILY